MPKWWDDLDETEQEAYLKDHPRSKLKPSSKKSDEKQQEQPVEDENKGSLKKATKSVLSYIRQNPGKFALAAATTLAGMNKRYDDDIDNMPKAKRSGLAAAIKTAIGLKDSKSLKQLSYKVGLSTGALFLGATAFSLVTGINVAVAVPILASQFWDKVVEVPDDVEYLKNVGRSYIETVKENLENEDIVKKAVVNKKPDIVVDTNSGETASYKRFTISSNHETDLNKTIAAIEKANISKSTSNVLSLRRSAKKPQQLINHMRYLEDTIPTVTTILVAGISASGNLGRRATEQLNALNNDFLRCREQLAELAASDAKLVRTPFIAKLRRLVKSNDRVKSGFMYVEPETGCLQLCEMHNFERVDVNETAFNNVTFYAYKDNSHVCVAHTINSSFVPKAFERIKIGDLSNWLESNMLRVRAS